MNIDRCLVAAWNVDLVYPSSFLTVGHCLNLFNAIPLSYIMHAGSLLFNDFLKSSLMQEYCRFQGEKCKLHFFTACFIAQVYTVFLALMNKILFFEYLIFITNQL